MQPAPLLVAVLACSALAACEEHAAQPEAPAMSNSSIALQLSPDEISAAEAEARRGSAEAALKLARHYGELTPRGPNAEQFAWLERAVENGSSDAIHELAMLLARRQDDGDCRKSLELAGRWSRESAKAPDDFMSSGLTYLEKDVRDRCAETPR